MRKDMLARRALALALLAPLAAVGCADEGMDEDLDTDFDATTETTDARGQQFDLEAMNDSDVQGEGWALTRGDSLVVTLNLEGQAATEELALFMHRGTCGDEAAPVVTEMDRDRMAATGSPTAGTPGQPGTGQAGQTGQTGQTGDATAEDAPATTGTGTTAGTGQMGGMTYTVALSELGTGMGAGTGMDAEAGTDPTTGTDAGMDGTAQTDQEFSVRAHPAGTTQADLGGEEEQGRALFCGEIPQESLRGGAAGTTGTTGTGTPAGGTGTTGDQY